MAIDREVLGDRYNRDASFQVYRLLVPRRSGLLEHAIVSICSGVKQKWAPSRDHKSKISGIGVFFQLPHSNRWVNFFYCFQAIVVDFSLRFCFVVLEVFKVAELTLRGFYPAYPVMPETRITNTSSHFSNIHSVAFIYQIAILPLRENRKCFNSAYYLHSSHPFPTFHLPPPKILISQLPHWYPMPKATP